MLTTIFKETKFRADRIIGSSFPKRDGFGELKDYLHNTPQYVKLTEEGIPEIHQRDLFQDEFDDRLKEATDNLSKEFKGIKAGVTWFESCITLDGYNLKIVNSSRICLGRPIIGYSEGHFMPKLNVEDISGCAAVACGGTLWKTQQRLQTTFGSTSKRKALRQAKQQLLIHGVDLVDQILEDQALYAELYSDWDILD